MPYEYLDHTGDTAVLVTAADEAELLAEAARALRGILVDEAQGGVVECRERHRLELEAEDGASLLVDFLNELIFLFDSQGFLCAEVEAEEVSTGESARFRGTLSGESYDSARHRSLTEVKAATFHDLEIERLEKGLRARIVFDL